MPRMRTSVTTIVVPAVPLAAALLAFAPPAAGGSPAPPAVPPTRVETVTDTYHGEQVTDDYRWLEALEKDSKEVAAWTTAQNDRTRAVLDALACRSRMEEALRPLMQIGSISAPRMRQDLYFYGERSGTQNQPVVKVRTGADGPPRVLLDPNALDKDGLISLDWYDPSWDGRTLAFGISRAGSEMSELHLLDVASGTWLADEISGKVSFSGWTPDGRAAGKFKWGLKGLPHKAGAKPVTVMFGANICIFKSQPDREKVAWEFIKFFTSPPITARWATATGYLPVRKSAAKVDKLAAYYAAAPLNRAAYDLLPQAVSEPNIAGWQSVRKAIETAETGVATQVKRPEDAVKELQEAANKALSDTKR